MSDWIVQRRLQLTVIAAVHELNGGDIVLEQQGQRRLGIERPIAVRDEELCAACFVLDVHVYLWSRTLRIWSSETRRLSLNTNVCNEGGSMEQLAVDDVTLPDPAVTRRDAAGGKGASSPDCVPAT